MTAGQSPRRPVSRFRWVLVAIGGFLVAMVIGNTVAWLYLASGRPIPWQDLGLALVIVAVTSSAGATVIVGLLARLSGMREWLLGLAVVGLGWIGPAIAIALVEGLLHAVGVCLGPARCS